MLTKLYEQFKTGKFEKKLIVDMETIKYDT